MSTPTIVDTVDPSKKTSMILDDSFEEQTVQMKQVKEKCYWNDVVFEVGEKVQIAERCYECSFGRWVRSED